MKIALAPNQHASPAEMSFPNDEIHRAALITLLKEIGDEIEREESALPDVPSEVTTA